MKRDCADLKHAPRPKAFARYSAVSPVRLTWREALVRAEAAALAAQARRERAVPHRDQRCHCQPDASTALATQRARSLAHSAVRVRLCNSAAAHDASQHWGGRRPLRRATRMCKALRRAGQARARRLLRSHLGGASSLLLSLLRRGRLARVLLRCASGQAHANCRAGGCKMCRKGSTAACADKLARAPGDVPAASSASACGRQPGPQLQSTRGRVEQTAASARGASSAHRLFRTARRTLLLVIGLGGHGADVRGSGGEG